MHLSQCELVCNYITAAVRSCYHNSHSLEWSVKATISICNPGVIRGQYTLGHTQYKHTSIADIIQDNPEAVESVKGDSSLQNGFPLD